MQRITLTTRASKDYELIDSGNDPARPDDSGQSGGEKLERYGDVKLVRPDPQALWDKKLDPREWDMAAGRYVRRGEKGEWVGELPKQWEIEFGGSRFFIKPTSFKHTGLFPEQLPNWEWIAVNLLSQRSSDLAARPQASHGQGGARPFAQEDSPSPKVLNLFAYTGGATLACAAAGAEVVHVDASKTAVAWARENAKASGLEDRPVRWIIEDALTFVRREAKRGSKYDAVIMDPPAFGHGPKGELWKIEEDFLELVRGVGALLSHKPLFVLMSGYAAGYSSLAFAYNLEGLVQKFGGGIEHGDLTIEERGSGRLLPCGIFARWSK